MITTEQEREINLYLLGKNLPMDVLLEVKDHMVEQIENMEDVDFGTAFNHVKLTWEKELTLKWYFWSFGFRTKLHQQALYSAIKSKVTLSFKLLLAYILVYSFLFSINANLAYYFIYSIHIMIGIISSIVCLFNYKLLNTTTFNYKKKISYLQRGSAILFVSWFQLMIVILFSFDMHFNHLKNFIGGLMKLNVSDIPYLSLISLHLWAFLIVLGYLYFVDYKKTITNLQKRINLKL